MSKWTSPDLRFHLSNGQSAALGQVWTKIPWSAGGPRASMAIEARYDAFSVRAHEYPTMGETKVTRMMRSLAIGVGAISVLVSIGGGVAQAAASSAFTESGAVVRCNAPGTGNTTVWGKCWNNGNKTGQARLVYWCKNMMGNGSRQQSTGWKNIKPGKTVKFVGECTFKARNPDFHVR
ncbi:hypothetical protein ACTMTI_38070 [Nonomuraea sp. H19]|uniref:hypothetical protein n=1 Tax=Nonomuraea sp. H19 TaxID=3452206 RepID=UPI003F894B0C